MNPTSPRTFRHVALLLTTIAAAWAAAVVAGARTGAFAALPMPWIAVIVAITIVVPTAWYFAWPPLQAFADALGHRPLMALHVWRIPAALLFFWFGLRGELPPLFWTLAGVGDFIAGSYAAWLLTRPASARRYRSFHAFGFADFVVAVGTGLTFTLLEDPRMGAIASLPLALIPLFGVGISGTTHLVAFDMLRRGTGSGSSLPAVALTQRPAT